jgi:hypothetical protein
MSSPNEDPDRDRKNGYAWEGGGKRLHSRPPDEGRDVYPERDGASVDHHDTVNDADFYHDRLTPGGQTPAHTPGGTGPSTRDTEHAVADDANEDVVKREKLGGDLRKPFEQGDA